MTQQTEDLASRSFSPRFIHHLPLQNGHQTLNVFSTQNTNDNLTEDVLWELLSEPQHQYKFQGSWQIFVILGYSLLIVVGIVSNGLVCFVVTRQWSRRVTQFGGKTRNLYILNLALADLLLCCVCMPLTLHNLLYDNWAMGIILCKLSPVIQAGNMLVSAGTVTAIALDRFNTIVRSPRSRIARATATRASIARPAFGITVLWLFSSILVSPLFIFTQLEPFYVGNVFLYNRCIERWPSDFSKLAFSTTLTAVQFVIPVCILSTVHFKISAYLKKHLRPCQGPKIKIDSPLDPLNDINKATQDDETLIDERALHKEFLNIGRKGSICSSDNSQRSDSSRKNSDCSESKRYETPDISPRKRKRFMSSFRENSEFSFSFSMLSREWSKKTPRRIRRELRRNRRTTILLACIASVYAVSWLPYHLYNIMTHAAPFLASSPIANSLFHPKTLLKAFAVAHLLAMTSVCVNPFLYGWLNTNFRRQFINMYQSFSNCFSNVSRKSYNSNNNNEFMKNENDGEVKKTTCLSFNPKRERDCVIVSLFKHNSHEPNV